MRYIRTKNGKIFQVLDIEYFGADIDNYYYVVDKNEDGTSVVVFIEEVIKEVDTIEELCDEIVIKYDNDEKPRIVNMIALLESCSNLGIAFKRHIQWLYRNYKEQLEICCLSIWVGAKLIPVAKLNKEGELELL